MHDIMKSVLCGVPMLNELPQRHTTTPKRTQVMQRQCLIELLGGIFLQILLKF